MADNFIGLNIGGNAPEQMNKIGNATEQTAASFKSAKAELRALQAQMGNMDVNSKEFAVAAERAGKLKDQLNDAADAVKGSTGPAFESMNNTFGIMGQQITNLDFDGLGQSFTSLGRSITKINFNSIKDELSGLVKGLANMGKALLSNPIFLIGAAVAAVVVYWDDISGAISGTTRKVEELTKANEDLEATNKKLDSRLKHEQLLYGNTQKLYDLQINIARNNIKIAENELDIAKSTKDIEKTREAENKLIEARNALTAISDQQEKNRLTAVEQARQLTNKNYKEYADNVAMHNELNLARNQTLEGIKAKEQEIADLKALQNTNETYGFNLGEKKLVSNGAILGKQNELNQLKQQEKDLTEGLAKLDELRSNIGKKSAEELKREREAAQKEAEQKEIEKRKKLKEDEEWQLEYEQLKLKRIDEVRAEGERTRILNHMAVLSRITELDERFSQDQLQLERDREAREKELNAQRVQMSADAIGALIALNNSYSAKSEETAKRQFQIGKALSLAQAIISTYQAVNQQLAVPQDALTGANFVKAGIALATGLANVIKISSTQFKSSSTPSGGGAPSLGSSGGGSGGTQPTTLSLGFLNNQPQQQQPFQAYVIGSQVNTAIEAQALIRNQARLH